MASNDEDVRGVFARGARITVVGAGRMGLPISGNLKAAGYDVVVTDVRSEVAEAVMAQGARWEPVAEAAVTGADIVITVLPGVPEIVELMASHGPLLPALAARTTWVDLTTSSPLVMKPIQDRPSPVAWRSWKHRWAAAPAQRKPVPCNSSPEAMPRPSGACCRFSKRSRTRAASS